MAAFAHLLKRLNEIPEGNGTLLDNTVLLYGSPAGEGGHSPFKLPIIVAGNRDGKLRQGQHVVYPGAEQRRTPLSNLLLTLLQVTGVATESFGDSTKVLPELLV